MLGILIDAVLLMVLLKVISEEEINFMTSFAVAFVTSIATTILAVVLSAMMGVFGIILAAVIAAALLGVAVSALFGLEIKRSFLIGGIFMLIHIGVGVSFWLLFST